jgi:hypothetical protein
MEICVEVLHKSTSYRHSSALANLVEMFNTIHGSIRKAVSSTVEKTFPLPKIIYVSDGTLP